MKRIQLFEFEDFEWFPKTIRTSMTNLLNVLHKLLGTTEQLSNLLIKIQSKYKYKQVVDLGSGSGGAMPDAIEALNSQTKENVNLLLTDLHPNPNIIERFNTKNLNHISYQESSLNATQLDAVPKGLKTMINSFHHMPVKSAKSILKSAQDNNEPIFIYELSENKIPTLLWWIFLPISLCILIIMSLLMTPFCKPLTWQQLVFTYLIPIIPLAYAWDGQASNMRTYAFNDIELMLTEFKNANYSWEISKAKKSNGKYLGYYILGLPK